MKITSFTTENLTSGCVTDNAAPRFSYRAESDANGASIADAHLCVNGWAVHTKDQILIPYGGEKLEPFCEYTAKLTVTDTEGETAFSETTFRTGRMGTIWKAKWITDGEYVFKEKKVSPIPMVFKKKIKTAGKIESAWIYATAIGVYTAEINGERVGDEYMTPGFTSYKHTLQYQSYDVTSLLTGDDELVVHVSGGWAVGSFVFTRKNRITAPRQALLLELRVTYSDGKTEVFATDESWDVSEEGPYRAADIYDGETYDATVDLNAIKWSKAREEKLGFKPEILAEYGSPVKAHEAMRPVAVTRAGGEIVYDFGQNFAGVVRAKICGKKGQKVVLRHAEVLLSDGTLFTKILRSAKQTATYICKEGAQVYSPLLTYMGFRYVGVSGIDEKDLELEAVALYSDMDVCGSFECSDERINRLQSNIVWSSKSNLFDIPTDCPQRDERMGWTGDIAVFSPTAAFNFDTSRFFEKWMRDLRSEQLRGGGIRNTVPIQGYGFPATMPAMAIDFWGDAVIMVPWAEYLSRGDIKVLERNYAAMKKYVKACKFWAGLFSFGKHRYIWHNLSFLHFGDWVAPDVSKMSQWQKRHKYTATASLCHTSATLSKIAKILGNEDDAEKYEKMAARAADAYVSVFTDKNGKMKKEEFQTAYVLPLAFDMFPEGQREKAADNLARIVKKNGYRIGTGFPGTPYILNALCDNGKAEEAFSMLTCDDCPSWLYEVRSGGTTMWERWDGLNPDGSVKLPSDGTDCMISFNHYASGAVGNFLYTRVAGIEAVKAGYREFRIKPVMGGGLTAARAVHMSPYGEIVSDWKIEGSDFNLKIKVPMGTTCRVTLPDGSEQTVESGEYEFSCEYVAANA